jgi:hypothetical protein
MDLHPSEISSHGGACCEAAQDWLVALATSANPDGGASPHWIGQHIEWGPVVWPTFWCRLLDSPEGDCGVHAAVAAYTCKTLGATVRRVQLMLDYPRQEVAHWNRTWERSDSITRWTDGTQCYHETVALGEAAIQIPDASEPIIWTGRQDGIVALRIVDPDGEGTVDWEARDVLLNEWIALDAD